MSKMDPDAPVDFDIKYRPKCFADVVGQKDALNVVAGWKKVPRCLLLSGASGTGKTTLARIICGTKLDVSRMDLRELNCGEHESAIEMVRDIGAAVSSAPMAGKHRVWIMDEVQVLSRTKFAQETLLKILEREDTPHVHFMLCIGADEKVQTESGMKPIRLTQPGDRLYTEDGWTEVKRVIPKGTASTVLLTTEKGSSVRVTEDHRIRVFDGERIVWKQVGLISDGDYLPIHHAGGSTRGTDHTLKQCEFLGRMVGDGWWTQGHMGAVFNEQEAELGRALLKDAQVRYTESARPSNHVVYFNILDRPLIRSLFGMYHYKRGHKTMPTVVDLFNREQFISFLRGWVGADGCESPGSPSLPYVNSTGSRRLYGSNFLLLSHLKQLAASFGIISNVRRYTRTVTEDSKTTGVKKGVYNNCVMMFGSRKPAVPVSDRLREHLSKTVAIARSVRPGSYTGSRRYRPGVSKDMILCSDLDHLKGDVVFEKFYSRSEARVEQVYDLEMNNDSQSFVVQGFSVHNCTTDPNRLLASIRGRCEPIDLRSIPAPDILVLLKRIAKAEKIDPFPDDRLLDRICDASGGAARNAVKLLQKVAGIADPDARLSAIDKGEVEKVAFDLAKELLPFSGGAPNWGGVCKVLTGLKDEDPEGIRQVVLATARTALLRPNAKNCELSYKVIRNLDLPLDHSKNAGHALLAAACYRIVHAK